MIFPLRVVAGVDSDALSMHKLVIDGSVNDVISALAICDALKEIGVECKVVNDLVRYISEDIGISRNIVRDAIEDIKELDLRNDDSICCGGSTITVSINGVSIKVLVDALLSIEIEAVLERAIENRRKAYLFVVSPITAALQVPLLDLRRLTVEKSFVLPYVVTWMYDPMKLDEEDVVVVKSGKARAVLLCGRNTGIYVVEKSGRVIEKGIAVMLYKKAVMIPITERVKDCRNTVFEIAREPIIT